MWRYLSLLAIVATLAFAACDGGGDGDPTATPPAELTTAASPTAGRFDSGRIAEADDDPSLPGEFVDLQAIYGGFYGNPDGPTTAPHVTSDVDYVGDGNSNPPTGGPHWGSGPCGSDPTAPTSPFCGPAPWGIYREPWTPETLVHNMEHSGVVIWYNTADEAVIDELEDLATERLNEGQTLVLAPYPDMEAEHVAITSWSRIDKFSVEEFEQSRVEAFIDAHLCRFDPEGFCGRTPEGEILG